MSNRVKAFVEYIHTKDRTNQNNGSRYTTYNVKLQDPETGRVFPQWYQFGFEEPKSRSGRVMAVGDYIQVDADPVGDAMRVVKGSLRIHPNPPERPANPEKGAGNAGGGKSREPKHSDTFGEIGGWYTEDDLRRITYKEAVELAMRAVEVLKALDALKVSEAQGQAGVAKRYEQTVSIIDKLTVKYYNDLIGLRALDNNEDEGEVGKGHSQPLPSAEPTGDAFPDEDGDDFPPEEDPDEFD